MVRFQRAMRELAQDGETDEVKLREGDYWVEFAGHLNIVSKKLQKQSQPAKMGPAEEADLVESVAATVDYEPSQTENLHRLRCHSRARRRLRASTPICRFDKLP
ncbi:MAG: hypothetical protein CMJ64_27975 [Planctomycetaceae bacterium]|nr:hypothetical protein [Planctomycetaceae bacterium]